MFNTSLKFARGRVCVGVYTACGGFVALLKQGLKNEEMWVLTHTCESQSSSHNLGYVVLLEIHLSIGA